MFFYGFMYNLYYWDIMLYWVLVKYLIIEIKFFIYVIKSINVDLNII